MSELAEWLPAVDDDTQFYWEGTKSGRLLIQRCAKCGTLRHPPSPLCHECHSFDWDTVEAGGRGTLYSVVKVHYPPTPPYGTGYLTAVIELAEGPRLVSNLTGCDLPEAEIEMPVSLYFEPVGGGYQLPLFRPAADRWRSRS